MASIMRRRWTQIFSRLMRGAARRRGVDYDDAPCAGWAGTFSPGIAPRPRFYVRGHAMSKRAAYVCPGKASRSLTILPEISGSGELQPSKSRFCLGVLDPYEDTDTDSAVQLSLTELGRNSIALLKSQQTFPNRLFNRVFIVVWDTL